MSHGSYSFRRQLIADDCRELHRKGLLTDEQLFDYETRLLQLPEPIDTIVETADGTNNEGGDDATRSENEKQIALFMAQIRALYQHELELVIAKIRAQHNEKKQDAFVTSDFVALATGGVLGALNAWMKPAAATPAPAAAPAPAATSLWASAFDAAQASLNVVRKRRLLEHLQIKHLSGDESTCDHIVLCINGFMTQGADPTRNWGAWFGGEVVVYAVLWEAGDVDAWNDFCAHVNDQIDSSSTAAAASALITHFTGNPWHKAQDQAEQVGVLLAQVLASQPTFCRGRKVTLFGHSLGGAVIYSTFQELARLRAEHQDKRDQAKQDGDDSRIGIHLPPTAVITNAVCFAGAFIPSTNGLENIAQELSSYSPTGKFINVFSKRDSVLSKLFWALQLHASDPIAAGCAAVKFPPVGLRNCVNVDVTDLIPPRITNQFGHGYGPHMDSIRVRVRKHLSSIYN
ncbi:hypothetical protein FI667_g11614, partial [Globisporangium splendens]